MEGLLGIQPAKAVIKLLHEESQFSKDSPRKGLQYPTRSKYRAPKPITNLIHVAPSRYIAVGMSLRSLIFSGQLCAQEVKAFTCSMTSFECTIPKSISSRCVDCVQRELYV